MSLKMIFKRVLTLVLIIPILTTITISKVYASDAINSPDWIPVISVYDPSSNPLTVKNYFIRSGSPFQTSYTRESTGSGYYVGHVWYGHVDYVIQTCKLSSPTSTSCYVSPVQTGDLRVDILTFKTVGIASASTFISTPGLVRHINGDYVIFGIDGFDYRANQIQTMVSLGMIPSLYFNSSSYNNSIDISLKEDICTITFIKQRYIETKLAKLLHIKEETVKI